MSDCVIVTGPTATGKTACAMNLSKELNGDIISSDSRQAYQFMDIGSGKDITANSQYYSFDTITIDRQEYRIGYYIENGVRIWLYDVATPTQPMSSAIFRHLALSVMEHLKGSGRLPIIVGGTGYYLSSLVSPPASLTVAPNPQLRQKYQHLSIEELKVELEHLNPGRLTAMNHSDQQNPRRLIRALEVALTKNLSSSKIEPFSAKTCWVGLTAPVGLIVEKIVDRVSQRIEAGFIDEVKLLLDRYPSFPSTPAGQTLGYRELTGYLSGKINYETAINLWIRSETQYMKRQLTWFKKQSDIHWFDITSENWYAQAKATLMKAGILCRT